MNNQSKKPLVIGLILIVLFAVWTVAVGVIDVQPIGPNGSLVGFAAVNGWFHDMTGVNFMLYNITDWLGIIPFLFVFGFFFLGIYQLITRKSLKKVDYSIWVLGFFYAAVAVVYVLFEVLEVNYRPVLIEGVLEASYPSSTTMLALCVMPTAMMQLNGRIKNDGFRNTVDILIIAFTGFMAFGRLISGVHWLTDIIGGAIFSAGLVLIYWYMSNRKADR